MIAEFKCACYKDCTCSFKTGSQKGTCQCSAGQPVIARNLFNTPAHIEGEGERGWGFACGALLGLMHHHHLEHLFSAPKLPASYSSFYAVSCPHPAPPSLPLCVRERHIPGLMTGFSHALTRCVCSHAHARPLEQTSTVGDKTVLGSNKFIKASNDGKCACRCGSN